MIHLLKNKKVIITGNNGARHVLLEEMLRSIEANVVDYTGKGHTYIAENLADDEPKVIFHIATHPYEITSNSIKEGSIFSPYLHTSQILSIIKSTPSVVSAILVPHKESASGAEEPLLEEEIEQLAHLLERVDNIQIRGEVWHQLVKKFITVPIELCILDDQDRVFLVYRKDREFDGYHMPGTVVNDWETVDEARKRLIKGEVIKDAGLQVSEPISIGWLEVRRGDGPEENKTRNAISLLHISRLIEGSPQREGMGFFSFSEIPENTLGSHKILLRYFKRYLENKEIILGK